jgi:hypothetical protein
MKNLREKHLLYFLFYFEVPSLLSIMQKLRENEERKGDN